MSESLDNIIICAKEQLCRDQMLARMGHALRALNLAQCMAMHSGAPECVADLEQARSKIADVLEIIVGKSGRYIRENSEETT